MEYKDYYKILGVDRKASEDEIKRAYRKLARKLHPDVNPGDESAEARFKDINEAYEVLGDPDKRSKYERLGSSWQQWQGAGRDPGGFDWSQWFSSGSADGARVDFRDLGDLLGGGSAGGFSDFFNSLFGNGMAGSGQPRGYSHPTRGQAIEQAVEISLEEAYRGTTRTLKRSGQHVKVKIPAGAYTGLTIRLAGQGVPIMGGAPGDLHLKITVKPHPRFTRQGDNLHTETPLNLYTATLGGETPIETLEGEVQLKIPAGTQGGQVFRLRGKGMPRLRKKGKHGDLYARLTIRIPEKLSAREKKLFQELSTLSKR